ncbi:hypothetical protein JW899_02165 [Candidatus Uhrbacteria bacterium]|nr:hypothetical protein [Candidatus Uhrbacteria bacterium]
MGKKTTVKGEGSPEIAKNAEMTAGETERVPDLLGRVDEILAESGDLRGDIVGGVRDTEELAGEFDEPLTAEERDEGNEIVAAANAVVGAEEAGAEEMAAAGSDDIPIEFDVSEFEGEKSGGNRGMTGEQVDALVLKERDRYAKEVGERADEGGRIAESVVASERDRFVSEKLEQAGARVAELTVRLKKGGSKQEKENLNRELEEAKAEYEKWRTEKVGEDLRLFLEERMGQVERQRQAVESERGFVSKIFEVNRQLGDMNLTRLGWRPEGKVGRFLAKGLSVRTAIGGGLLVGGWALGGAAAAGGAAAYGLKRIFGGLMATGGLYYAGRGLLDRKFDRMSPEKIQAMTDGEIQDAMSRMAVRAAAGGRTLKDHPAYFQMAEVLGERWERAEAVLEAEEAFGAEAGRTERDGVSPEGELEADIESQAGEREGGTYGKIQDWVAEEDRRMAEMAKSDKWKDAALKVGAAGAGILVGSGEVAKAFGKVFGVAKEFLGIGGETAAKGIGSVAKTIGTEGLPPTPLAPIEVPEPSLEIPEAVRDVSAVLKGDGYQSIIGRQLAASPETFGYDPSADGDLGDWVRKTTRGIVRENGLLSERGDVRLRFSPEGSGRVYLVKSPDGFRLMKEGVREYVHRRDVGLPVPESADMPEDLSLPEDVREVKPKMRIAADPEGLERARAAAKSGEMFRDNIPERKPKMRIAADFEEAAGSEGKVVFGGAEPVAERPFGRSGAGAETVETGFRTDEPISEFRTDGGRDKFVIDRGEYGRQVLDIRLKGAKVEFSHDAYGRVTGCGVSRLHSIPNLTRKMESIVQLENLDQPWPIFRGIAKMRIESAAKKIVAFREALAELSGTGRGGVPEADFLKKEIVRVTADIERKYGDVIR